MKIVVLSDIHGNAFALEHIMPALQREAADHIVCLGDAVQGGAQPAETVALLRELGCPVVMGNADAWMLTGDETDEDTIPESRKIRLNNEVRDWSLAQLSAADKAFIASFQPTVTLPLDGDRTLLCFHGSPTSFDDILLPTTPAEDFGRLLAPYLPSVMCGGHTHMQQTRRLGADSFFFNPGSVGFAYSHYLPEGGFHADAWAEYAVLTINTGSVGLEFRRAPYDVKTLLGIYRSSGRPHLDEAEGQYATSAA